MSDDDLPLVRLKRTQKTSKQKKKKALSSVVASRPEVLSRRDEFLQCALLDLQSKEEGYSEDCSGTYHIISWPQTLKPINRQQWRWCASAGHVLRVARYVFYDLIFGTEVLQVHSTLMAVPAFIWLVWTRVKLKSSDFRSPWTKQGAASHDHFLPPSPSPCFTVKYQKNKIL